jgi:hypothetical protein
MPGVEPHFTGWQALYEDFVACWQHRVELKDFSLPFEIPVDALARLAHPDDEDVQWISQALRDAPVPFVGRPSFLCVIVHGAHALADVFLEPLVMAGVNEVDPGENKHFIRPAVKFFGVVPVRRFLYRVFGTGTPFQQAGALNAMYWAHPDFWPTTRDAEAVRREVDAYNAARRAESEQLTAEHAAFQRLALEAFITTTDADLRHSVWAHVGLNEVNYPEELRPLVREAIGIAESLDDDYIRACLDRAAGRRIGLVALPPRKWEHAGDWS